jgi:hypothetical protein
VSGRGRLSGSDLDKDAQDQVIDNVQDEVAGTEK